MRKRLILFLLFVLQSAILSKVSAQTQVYQLVRGYKFLTGAYYKRVLRDISDDKYPLTTAGDAKFYTDYNRGILAGNTFDRVAGVAWSNARITYNTSIQSIEIEIKGDPQQLKLDRLDNAPWTGSNPDRVAVQSGTFYNPKTISSDDGYTQRWVFGKNINGTGGIAATGYKLTVKNIATGAEYSFNFVPINKASKTQLYISGSASGTSPPPVTLASAYDYDGVSKGYNAYANVADGLAYEVLLTPLSGQSGTLPQTWRTMTATGGPWTVAGQSFNRKYLFAPGFAGGVDVNPGNWRQQIRKQGTTDVLANGTLTLSSSSSSGLVSSGSGGGVSCAFSIAANTVSSACGQNVTLTAVSSGTGATGLFYSWNINGATQTGQSVTIQAPSALGTYTYTVTASKSGCPNQTANATVNVTSCQSNLGYYNFAYIYGNSFTYTPTYSSGGVTWPRSNGMAASSLSNDFVHKFADMMRAKNPSFQFYASSNAAPFEGEYVTDSYDYQNRITNSLNSTFNNNPPLGDLIIIAIGENINEGVFNKTKFFAGLDEFISRIPKTATPTIMLRGALWSGHTTSTAAVQEYCGLRGYKYVSFDDRIDYPAYQATEFSDAGIRKHWNDAGHLEIATRFAAALTGTTPTTPGPVTPTDPTGMDFVSQADEGWVNSDATDMKYIENDVIRVGFRRQVGGAICYAAFKSTGRNLVNDPIMSDARADDYLGRYGKKFRDKGRQWMFAPYFTPGVRWQVTPTKNTGDFGYDSGGNVVQGGSLGNYYDETEILASKIYNHPKYGQTYYVKCRPRVWGVPREFADIYIEQWTWLSGATIGYFAKTYIGNVAGSQTRYEARQQELPCFYSVAPLTYQRVLQQDATPWTGGGTVDRFKPDFNTTGNFSTPYASGECWASLSEGPDGVTVACYTPGIDRGNGKKVGLNSRFITGQFNATYGTADELPASYGAVARMDNFDNTGVYETAGYFVLGTSLADARSKIAALPRPDQSFDFDFSNDLHAWWNLNCRFKKESGAWTAYLGDANQDGAINGELKAPYGAWTASSISTIKFDMEVTGANTLWFEWSRPGEVNDASRTHRRAFTGLVGDGVRRTYTISTSDPNWSGIISTLGLRAIRNGDNAGQPITPSNTKVKVYRIYKE